MQVRRARPLLIGWGIVFVVGILEALLLGRLIAQLLAARPDNAAVAWLYALSAPLRWPLLVLDRGQPTFGARLELSTLAMAAMLLVGGGIAWWLSQRNRLPL
jgi:hypothetical protein